MNPTAPLSPWNVMIGAWMNATRRTKQKSLGDVAQCFGRDVSVSYLRSIESGANALPSSAAPALVSAFGLEFETAAMIVAAVRMLDERRPRNLEPGRPYDLSRIEEQAANLKVLWPELSGSLDWLVRELERLRRSERPQAEMGEVRESCRTHQLAFDKTIRAVRQGDSAAPRRKPRALSPLVEDAMQEFVHRLSFWSPQMTRAQHYAWEAANAHRTTALWGLVSRTDDVIDSATTNNWNVLVNAHRPSLRIAVPGSREEAQQAEDEFRSTVERQLSRRDGKKVTIDVEVQSYAHLKAEVDALLWFDHSTRAPIEADIREVLAQGPNDGRFIRLKNFWLYELDRPEDGRSRVGLMDNYERDAPSFFSAALSAPDVDRWQDVLRMIHA